MPTSDIPEIKIGLLGFFFCNGHFLFSLAKLPLVLKGLVNRFSVGLRSSYLPSNISKVRAEAHWQLINLS